MARGQPKPTRPGAFGDARRASSNIAGTKEDRDMEPTRFTDRPDSGHPPREDPQEEGNPPAPRDQDAESAPPAGGPA
jgi:hypothetical protein